MQCPSFSLPTQIFSKLGLSFFTSLSRSSPHHYDQLSCSGGWSHVWKKMVFGADKHEGDTQKVSKTERNNELKSPIHTYRNKFFFFTCGNNISQKYEIVVSVLVQLAVFSWVFASKIGSSTKLAAGCRAATTIAAGISNEQSVLLLPSQLCSEGIGLPLHRCLRKQTPNESGSSWWWLIWGSGGSRRRLWKIRVASIVK